jgi:ankyrin repeat protein
MQHILQQTTKRALLESVHSLKFDLSLAYKATIERLNSIGLRLIQWIYYTDRLLTFDELRYAASITPQMRDFDPELDLLPPSYLDSTLGLLTVDSNEQGLVRFAHVTVKDYLSQHASSHFPLAHSMLAETMLTYLNLPPHPGDADRLSRFDECGDLYPFFHYTATKWGQYVRQQSEPGIAQLAEQWLSSPQFEHVHGVRRKHSPTTTWFSHGQHSALHEACFFGLTSIVEGLLRRGHDVNSQNTFGATPLNLAISSGYADVAEILLSHPSVDVNFRHRGGLPPLYQACWEGDTHVDVVNALLKHPLTQVDMPTLKEQSPLHIAAVDGHQIVVEVLLNHPGIQASSRDKLLKTPLHYAAETNRVDIVRSLLRHPTSEVNAVDLFGWTPLHHAATYGCEDIVRVLIQHPEILVNSRDPSGWTPFHCADRAGYPRIVHLLRQHPNIDLSLKPLSRTNPVITLRDTVSGVPMNVMQRTYRPHDDSVIDSFPVLNGWTSLHLAAMKGYEDLVRYHFDYPKMQLNRRDSCGLTALHFAAREGHASIVKMLLERREVDINAADRYGWTPLTFAVDRGRVGIVEILLQHKDLDIKASKVTHPLFLDSIPEEIKARRRYTRLPEKLLVKLGIQYLGCFELTDREIELFVYGESKS